MKETPILFNAPMVRAILEGRKSQTRRVVKIPGGAHWSESDLERYSRDLVACGWCPFGRIGDRIVMLTTWATEKQYDVTKPSRLPDSARIWSLWDGDKKPEWCGRLRPGRFLPGRFRHLMPRSEITDVRVQRVQDITEEDAKAEGANREAAYDDPDLKYESYDGQDVGAGPGYFCPRSYVDGFRNLWDSINAKRGFGWDSNPWVWAITFKKL